MRSPILCAATHKIVGGCYHSYVDKYLSTHFLLLSLHASDDGIVRGFWSLLGYKPYHYALVEAPYPSKVACTSMWSTHKVFELLHMQWMGLWNHRQLVTIALVVPDFDSRLKAWVTAGLQTIPLCSG